MVAKRKLKGRQMDNPFKRILGGNEEVIPPVTEMQGDNSEIRPNDQRVVGKIIKVSPAGWGFITSKDIPFTRIFFHWTSLRQDTKKFTALKLGDRVEFTPVEVAEKGTRAIKIKVVEEAHTEPAA